MIEDIGVTCNASLFSRLSAMAQRKLLAVTEDVIQRESFSENKPTTLPKPKTSSSTLGVKASRPITDDNDDAMPIKKKRKNRNNAGQRTLLNFFGKA
jgi:hypothetical protein